MPESGDLAMVVKPMLRKIYRPRRFHNYEELPKRTGGGATGGMPLPPPPVDADDNTRYVARDGAWRPAGEVYVHNQPTVSMRWTIQHCLGRLTPQMVLTSETGQVMWGTPDWATATDNYLEILFAIPSRGTAYLS